MEVKALRNTNIRKSCTRLVDSDLIGQINHNVTFEIVDQKFKGITQKADGFGESDIWYKDNNGWFYWSGSLEIQPPIPTNIETVELSEQPQPTPTVPVPITDPTQIQWNYNTLIKNVPATWLTTEGANINIIIIDNAFNLNHPALKHLDIAGRKYDATVTNFMDSTGNDTITGANSDHGNEVTSMLAAMPFTTFSLKGVATKANYFFIKANRSFKHSKYFVNALELATQKLNADIISFSIPFMARISPQDETRRKNVMAVIESEKIALIGSIANSENLIDTLNQVPYPANQAGTFTVGALTQKIFNDNPGAKYSNQISILMPSIEKFLCNTNASDTLVGSSSFATPYFAGVLACYLSQLGGRDQLKTNPAFQSKNINQIIMEEFVKANQQVFRSYSEYAQENVFLIPPH